MLGGGGCGPTKQQGSHRGANGRRPAAPGWHYALIWRPPPSRPPTGDGRPAVVDHAVHDLLRQRQHAAAKVQHDVVDVPALGGLAAVVKVHLRVKQD